MDNGSPGAVRIIDRSIETEASAAHDTALPLILRGIPEGSKLEKAALFWDHRRFLFRVVLWAVSLSAVVAFLIPKEYSSSVRLMPPDQQSGMGAALLAAVAGKASGVMGGLAGDVLGMKNTGDLLVGVLESRMVEESLIQKFDLRKVYGDRLWTDARKDLEKRTEVAQNRKSGIITIKVTDHDPKRAQLMAEEYSAELNRVLNEVNTSSAHRERIFLEGRLKEIKKDLEDSEREFSQFSSKNTAIDIKEQGKAMVEAAALLQGQLVAAESELEGLRQIYTANNVRVKAAEARITELKAQLAKMGGAEDGYSSSGDKDTALYPSIRQLPLLGVPYADLYRRMKIDEVAFEALTQQYELAKVEEAKDIPSVKILDSAELPEKKSFPPRLLLIFLGTTLSLAGAMLGLVATKAWETADYSDPKKAFLKEVFHGAEADFARVLRKVSYRRKSSQRRWGES